MHLLESHLKAERDNCLMNGVRIRVIGRRDRLSLRIRNAIESTERETACGRTLEVRLAIDYSARDAIARRRRTRRPNAPASTSSWGPRRSADPHRRRTPPERLPALGIGLRRTLLHPCMWPDFGAAELEAALADFHKRERRFGALPEAVGF
jgi:undecaprenyl diphosphate synthase